MRLVSEREVDVDYFYRERKDGSKKITYTVRCVDETRLYSQVHLEEIQLRVVDRWYNTNNLPIFKAQFYKYYSDKFITILISQIIYIIIGYLLCLFIYKKGVKRLNVNGG